VPISTPFGALHYRFRGFVAGSIKCMHDLSCGFLPCLCCAPFPVATRPFCCGGAACGTCCVWLASGFVQACYTVGMCTRTLRSIITWLLQSRSVMCWHCALGADAGEGLEPAELLHVGCAWPPVCCHTPLACLHAALHSLFWRMRVVTCATLGGWLRFLVVEKQHVRCALSGSQLVLTGRGC
jgi:hypothetical protein